ncbi:hypothetical protein [Sulfitobacter geojensis]|uniref:hypothetical protein n=1 Tax=Sulfitobacter geojensis TaxID=1342299 RepID=UPI0007D9EFE9|nr:hypothetical protein [Sulfitobacter geojensis]OAN86070.1 hypothetical protein A8B74_07435 [Sulfitobacter geojensis]
MAASERDNAGLEAEIGISLGKLTKQLAAAEARMVKTAKKYETDFANANRKVSKQFDTTSKSAQGSAQAMAKEMDNLRAKFDPMFAASKRYEASLEELKRAHKVGALNVAQYEAALENLNAEYARSTGGARALSGGLAGVTQASGSARHQIQNTAFQIGDFAVQVGAGTSAAQALGQQLPQLLGGFGIMGAVLGAVVAAGVPLVRFLMDSGEASVDLEERLATLTGAVSDYEQAVKDAQVPTDQLREKYGSAAQAAQEFVSALEGINKALALQALEAAQAIDAVDVTRLRELVDIMNGMGPRASFLAADALRDLQKEFNATEDEARALLQGIDALRNAEGPKQAVEASKELLATIEAIYGPFDQLTGAALELAQQVQAVGENAATLTGTIDDANIGVDRMTDGFSAASAKLSAMVDNAGALGDNMYRAAKAAWDFLGAYPDKVAYNTTVGRGRGADPRQFGGSAKDIQQNDPAAQLAYSDMKVADAKRKALAKASKASKSSGGRSKGKTETSLFDIGENTMQNLERQIEMIGKTGSEIAGLTAKYKLLDEAKKRGIDLDAKQAGSGKTVREQIDAQAEAIENLTKKADQYKERAALMDGLNQDLQDGFIDAIIAGESFGDVLSNLAKQLAKAALQAALFNNGPFASGGGSGLLGGLVSAVTGSIGGTTAAPTTSVRPTIRARRAPEVMTPATSDKIIASVGTASSGQPISVVNQIDARGADVGAVQRIEVALARSKAELPSQIIETVRSAKKKNVQI